MNKKLMRKFWISYLISNILLIFVVLAVLNNGNGSDKLATLTMSFLGAIIIPFPAIILGICEPKVKWKYLLGFVAALIGILLITLLLPALGSGLWK